METSRSPFDLQEVESDDAVCAHAKGPFLRGRTEDCLHALREESGKKVSVL